MGEPDLKRLDQMLRERGYLVATSAIHGPTNGWYMIQATFQSPMNNFYVTSAKWSPNVSDKDFAFGLEQALKAQGIDPTKLKGEP
jgi:hypothetical protein